MTHFTLGDPFYPILPYFVLTSADAGSRESRPARRVDRGLNDGEEIRGRIDATAALTSGLANTLAPEQSLLLDEYFLHRRRQVWLMVSIGR